MDTKLEVGCSNCTSVSTSPGANIASPIAMSLIGILGNAIALVTIHRMKLERQRTCFFVFVAGLAFADLLGQVLTTFPVLLTYSHGYYIGGSWMCSYHAFTMILFGILTPMIACAMALERYFGIRHGYFYMLHFNPQRARFTLLTLWLVAIIFSSLPFMGFGQYAIQYPGTWCFLNLHPENRIDAAYSVTFSILNLFLIIVMIICNIVVQCTLVALRCKRNSADRADRFRRTHRNPQQEELEVQMMFVLLAITFVFTLCWTPLQILKNQFYEHKTAADHAEDLLAVRLASINQILDPWVYILCKKICFRRGCSCWNFFVRPKWTGASSQRGDLNITSSLRSALAHFRAQSIRNSRDKAECDMVVQENGNASPMMVALHLDNGDIDPIATTSPMVCYDSATSAHGTAERTTSSSANNSSDYVPIPIFTSSQYSIHRRKRRRTRSGSKLPNKRPGKAFQPYATIASRRRRHSWCCLQEASRFMDRRDIIAHST